MYIGITVFGILFGSFGYKYEYLYCLVLTLLSIFNKIVYKFDLDLDNINYDIVLNG